MIISEVEILIQETLFLYIEIISFLSSKSGSVSFTCSNIVSKLIIISLEFESMYESSILESPSYFSSSISCTSEILLTLLFQKIFFVRGSLLSMIFTIVLEFIDILSSSISDSPSTIYTPDLDLPDLPDFTLPPL